MTPFRMAILALTVFGQGAAGQDLPAQITGVVTSNGPIPGVTVTADGLATREVAVTNESGGFKLTVPPGAYSITAEVPGFDTQRRTITVASGANRRLDFELALGQIEGEPLWVLRDAASNFRDALAVAHVRVERTQPPQNCSDSASPMHLVTVLSSVKGDLAPTTWLVQSSRFCFDRGVLEGTQDVYAVGDEYVAFLGGDGDRFLSLMGATTISKVVDGRIAGAAYPPMRSGMTIAEVWAALKQFQR
ncbi:MAG TPA: carboxypeptidase-like regulatory domain-containing protein [Vicinamibacterales bacterium]|nr:carboxypeptidase-like regulatory domain-containing protein [Vicinamibacterales bacterium]